MRLEAEGAPAWLFTENDTNTHRLFGTGDPRAFAKDGIDRYLVQGEAGAVNPARERHQVRRTALARSRARRGEAPAPALPPRGGRGAAFGDFDAVFAERLAEADAFYAALQRDIADPDLARVQRQALAGMLWSKQLYHYDVREWLAGDPAQPPPPRGAPARPQQRLAARAGQ